MTAVVASGCEGAAESPPVDDSQCASYRDARGTAPEVQVAVRNDGALPIYLKVVTSCERGGRHIVVTGPDDESSRWPESGCYTGPLTCESFMAGTCSCVGACDFGSPIRIEPGASYPTSWPGAIFVSDELPEACTSSGCRGSCKVVRQAPEGSYTVRVEASTSMGGCEPGDAGVDPCACDPSDTGWCAVYGGNLGDGPEQTAVLDYPDITSVELVFD